MPQDEKIRFIVRAAMTEYMILMIGAVLLYLAIQAWPKDLLVVGLFGGSLLAAACVLNFYLILKTSPLAPPATHHKPRHR